MTTAYAWFVRGRIDRSWRANPAGSLFAVGSIPLIVWFGACAARAEPVGFRSFLWPAIGLLITGAALIAASWLIRCALSPTALIAAGP
jgi:hypothetical protein